MAPNTSEVVVDGLNFPGGLNVGPDGALYISGPPERRESRRGLAGQSEHGWRGRRQPNGQLPIDGNPRRVSRGFAEEDAGASEKGSRHLRGGRSGTTPSRCAAREESAAGGDRAGRTTHPIT